MCVCCVGSSEIRMFSLEVCVALVFHSGAICVEVLTALIQFVPSKCTPYKFNKSINTKQ